MYGNQLKRRISGGKNHKYDVKLIKNISIGKYITTKIIRFFCKIN